MSFTIETGDLFVHSAEALAHGVNCQGVTGGLASVMADRYPDAMTQYVILAQQGRITPGSAVFTRNRGREAGLGRPIIHCASQNQPGPDATEQWLRASLTQGLDLAHKQGIGSVALPLIGGGIGGLDPAVAEQIIREVAEASPVAVTLVLFG
ncbi:RNase III inhibitor [Mycobacteroides abscessus]|uniref:Macro domain protein n=1 Tax=Mycobacteroides abscessus subsp. bolletii 1513 TaxID=1299321 RepID=X8DMP0_9MYCO|nr:macro domain-containing protein [Mycobacteroides abscessus]EUA69281.1 macro domain protein [Mycobacteroides abscessus subsp. bolletii 1513]EIU11961.1 macro domain protein [Mycobacteroides abscessus 5S-0304]EIU12633.1 macro domain protein [Mycobacteroides abscessus 5S-0421]EIU13038.1 macro domain protein [Mycobacteroides abscessus 5S-0422]EIU22529.1 macro domain protein [Mycobacteroides abscessus 5S-0708]